jgi:hypothetical protein
VGAKCGQVGAKCGQVGAKCGQVGAKCGQMGAKCGQVGAKCGKLTLHLAEKASKSAYSISDVSSSLAKSANCCVAYHTNTNTNTNTNIRIHAGDKYMDNTRLDGETGRQWVVRTSGAIAADTSNTSAAPTVRSATNTSRQQQHQLKH